jgi:hypothetical protein
MKVNIPINFNTISSRKMTENMMLAVMRSSTMACQEEARR